MSIEDKLTNVAVRRILTSLWVDITLVNVRTTGGVVYVWYHPKKAAQVYYSAAQGAALLMLSQNKNKELLSGSNLLRDITLNGLIK